MFQSLSTIWWRGFCQMGQGLRIDQLFTSTLEFLPSLEQSKAPLKALREKIDHLRWCRISSIPWPKTYLFLRAQVACASKYHVASDETRKSWLESWYKGLHYPLPHCDYGVFARKGSKSEHWSHKSSARTTPFHVSRTNSGQPCAVSSHWRKDSFPYILPLNKWSSHSLCKTKVLFRIYTQSGLA